MEKKTIIVDSEEELLESLDSDFENDKSEEKKPSNHYCDNDLLRKQLIEYAQEFKEARENDWERPQLPPYVSYSILEIAKRTSMLPSYARYPDREGMVGEAVLNLVKYIHNYKEEKSPNAFAYVTQMVKTSFWRYIEEEKKHVYVRAKKIQRAGVEDEIFDMQSQDTDGDFHNTFVELLQDSTDIVEDFEKKLEKKRKKARDKAREKRANSTSKLAKHIKKKDSDG